MPVWPRAVTAPCCGADMISSWSMDALVTLIDRRHARPGGVVIVALISGPKASEIGSVRQSAGPTKPHDLAPNNTAKTATRITQPNISGRFRNATFRGSHQAARI